jgi:hypothetical protein
MPCASLPGLLEFLCGRPVKNKFDLVMADEKTGKRPDKEGGLGKENAGPETAEAGPRSKRMAYTCWNDGASNYVEPGWEWFTCWRCGALVYTT